MACVHQDAASPAEKVVEQGGVGLKAGGEVALCLLRWCACGPGTLNTLGWLSMGGAVTTQAA